MIHLPPWREERAPDNPRRRAAHPTAPFSFAKSLTKVAVRLLNAQNTVYYNLLFFKKQGIRKNRTDFMGQMGPEQMKE